MVTSIGFMGDSQPRDFVYVLHNQIDEPSGKKSDDTDKVVDISSLRLDNKFYWIRKRLLVRDSKVVIANRLIVLITTSEWVEQRQRGGTTM